MQFPRWPVFIHAGEEMAQGSGRDVSKKKNGTDWFPDVFDHAEKML